MARDTSRRDSAGVGPDPSLTGHLTRMRDMSDFRIASGEADIRGWEVRTLSGSEVGKVDDLLIDPHRGEVVMVDIDLKDSNQHVTVPIRTVQIDRTRNVIIVDSGEVRSARDSINGYSDEPVATEEAAADAREIDARAADARLEGSASDEVVVDRRPVIEETVVKRRLVEPDTINEGEGEDEVR